MLSNLLVNHSKSEIFCSAIVNPILQQQILSSLHFNAGSLSVKYLGMSLIIGKLLIANCLPLIEKITARIKSWTAKKLSLYDYSNQESKGLYSYGQGCQNRDPK